MIQNKKWYVLLCLIVFDYVKYTTERKRKNWKKKFLGGVTKLSFTLL